MTAVKKILGAVTTVTAGVAELRNRGYGTATVPPERATACTRATPGSPSTPPAPGANSFSTP